MDRNPFRYIYLVDSTFDKRLNLDPCFLLFRTIALMFSVSTTTPVLLDPVGTIEIEDPDFGHKP
jgi:hypothetical protein